MASVHPRPLDMLAGIGALSYAGLRALAVPDIVAQILAFLAAFSLRASAIPPDIRMEPPGEFIRVGKTDDESGL